MGKRLRLWFGMLLRRWAEYCLPSAGITTRMGEVTGPPQAAIWDGTGPKHEVWRRVHGQEYTHTYQSGAQATAYYQEVVDHHQPGLMEFRTDGLVRSRYDGGDG